MKKLLFLIIILIILVIGAIAYLLVNDDKKEWSIKEGYLSLINKDADYRLQYREDLIVEAILRDDQVNVLGGSTITATSTPSKGHQLPNVRIAWLNREIMEGMPLENWIMSVSAKTQEELNTNSDKYRYISKGYKVISPNKIVFLVDETGFSSSPPTLIFDNGSKLIELVSLWADDLYFEVLENFEVEFGKDFIGLTAEEINIIKAYYEQNEIFYN
jgi:hypothetical protein